jgi:hypothetical protein
MGYAVRHSGCMIGGRRNLLATNRNRIDTFFRVLLNRFMI